MGRWAQRRRRGGDAGAEPPGPPPDPPAAVVSVTVDGGDAQTTYWLFDQPVTFSAPPVQCQVYDLTNSVMQPDGGSQVDGVTISLHYPNATLPGKQWNLTGPPTPDVTSPGGFTAPVSGSVV